MRWHLDSKLKIQNGQYATKINADTNNEYTFEHNEVPFAYKMEHINGFNG